MNEGISEKANVVLLGWGGYADVGGAVEDRNYLNLCVRKRLFNEMVYKLRGTTLIGAFDL
jgi:hypothetical protein